MRFLLDTLGMKVLRHEEFTEGCEAACNGPYDGRWSKTMVGYADESSSFALEITYNYTHPEPYKKGNDLVHIEVTVPSTTIDKARASEFVSLDSTDGAVRVRSPEGYDFLLVPGKSGEEDARISGVRIRSFRARNTLRFYTELLGMQEEEVRDVRGRAVFKGSVPFVLEMEELGEEVDFAEAGGRLAIAVVDPAPFERAVIDSNIGGQVHTPLVELHTPGKASVKVVILQDPDGSEVCVVNDDGFTDLSQVDPTALDALNKQIQEDKSKEAPDWMA